MNYLNKMKMNIKQTRNLILIGNGFDLAHGLKTSYEDFLFDYFIENFRNAIESTQGNRTGMYDYEDILFRCRIHSRGYFNVMMQNCKSLEELKAYVNSNSGLVKIEPLKPFSIAIYGRKDRWVDIEGIYYKQLRIIFKNNSITDKNRLFKELNEGLKCLKKRLEDYLEKHYKANDPNKIIDDFFFVRHLFAEQGEIKEKTESQNKGGHKFYMVNFNYTPTANLYIENRYSDQTIKVNHIHGQIDHFGNPIIFGYGDEKDKDYIDIENLEIDEAFENIKSFGYLQNDNYQNLLGFINGGKYNVVILGHSCGLSDRTLLSTIFEHPDCEKIRVCYYENDGWDDFTNKTYQMSRHFDDKKILRERIIPYKKYDRIPQYNDPK